MKLQDAFVAEKGTKVGNRKEIGYLMKNSSNFNYCDAASCKSSSNSDGYSDASGSHDDGNYEATWTASNIATLNDCVAGNAWALTTSQNGNAGGIVLYAATIDGQDETAGATGDCAVLTPNFYKLNTKTSGN